MHGKVGFIGLGTMGLPMAANLAKAGQELIVHDADAAALQRAAALPGARAAGCARDVAAQAELLFTCLPNNDTVLQAYLGPEGVAAGGRPGLVTCDCSTVSPEVTAEVAAALQARRITHLDTPMLGSQPQAVEGQIFFIVGGDPAALERVAPCLKAMGRMHMHVGGSGMAHRMKLIHNGLAAVTSVAVAEALALVVQSGADPHAFYELVRNGGGMAYGTYFERRAQRVLEGEFAPTFALELMRKDVLLDLLLAWQAGVPMPMLEAAQQAYDEAFEDGWGRLDFSAVTRVIEKRIGRTLEGKK